MCFVEEILVESRNEQLMRDKDDYKKFQLMTYEKTYLWMQPSWISLK
jgi:hypothetical protein